MFSLLVACHFGDRFYKVRPAAEALRVAEADGYRIRGTFQSREDAEAAGRKFLRENWN